MPSRARTPARPGRGVVGGGRHVRVAEDAQARSRPARAPATRSRRERCSRCPRSRPGPGPGCRYATAAGARASNRRPGAGTGRTRGAAAPTRSATNAVEPRHRLVAGSRPAPPPARAVERVQGHDVGGGGAVRHRVRAAGVVADHPAHGAPGVRRGIGAEAQPVAARGPLQLVQDHPRLDDGGPRVRVDADHLVEVAAQVEHDAGADRVARDRGAPAADGQRHGQLTADGRGGQDVVDGPREHHGPRDHPVVGGIGRVLGPPPRRGVHRGPELGPQPLHELPGRRVRGHSGAFYASHGKKRSKP